MLERYLKTQSQKIDAALLKYLPSKKAPASRLREAMHYAVLQGGKRIRPILLLEAARAVGGSEKSVMPAACAVEFVHSYSLVHDDLPCMDNDAERRGKPSCHIKFDEVTALLAGDALLTLAFEVLGHTHLEAIRVLASASGARGMVGGQALDMQYQNKALDLPTLEYINTHKSGNLIAASLKIGSILGGGTQKQTESLNRFGRCAGLLFQIVDDILDGEGYAKILGFSEAKQKASDLAQKAKKELSSFGKRAKNLHEITDFVLERKH